MSNATLEAAVCASDLASLASDASGAPLAALRRLPEVQMLVDGSVASWHSSIASMQSRRWHRIVFEEPLIVTPLDDSTNEPSGEAFVATGREISLTGLSFMHQRPLAARKVAVTFQFDDGTSESVVAQLRWCRFRGDGHYQSGGQFLRSIALSY